MIKFVGYLDNRLDIGMFMGKDHLIVVCFHNNCSLALNV